MNHEMTLAVVRQFNEATARQDVDEMMAVMTDDCLFDNTSPAPDGEAFRGQSAVRAFLGGVLPLVAGGAVHDGRGVHGRRPRRRPVAL